MDDLRGGDNHHERPVSPSSASECHDDNDRDVKTENRDEVNADVAADDTSRKETNDGHGHRPNCRQPTHMNNNYNYNNHNSSIGSRVDYRDTREQDDSYCYSQPDSTNNMQMPPFDPSQPSQEDFIPLHPSPNSILPPHFLLPNLALVPPSLTLSQFNLDVTRQYYEMQMREHAMQYANAAAGAAWAAARIAYGDNIYCEYPAAVGPPIMPGHMQIPSQYVPGLDGSTMHNGWFDNNPESGAASGPSRQRTLWNPPDARSDKCETSCVDQQRGIFDRSEKSQKKKDIVAQCKTSECSKPSTASKETKTSKKRESANDSFSSLGSGSRDHNNSNKNTSAGKKSTNRRRRIDNEHVAERKEEFHVPHLKHDNPRQKRGLYQSSPRSSSSSLGTSSNAPPVERNKRRNTQTITSPRFGGGSNIFLGGLIGKSGISALHELCSKYRWEMPKYELVLPTKVVANNGGDAEDVCVDPTRGALCNNHQDYVLSVWVNGVELGRGRGGTKASSKQDASRKALAALVPGVVFDPNGILLDVGSGSLRIIDENTRSTPTSLEELASQLVIGANFPAAGQRTRPSSPDISEDSSISTAVSMTKIKSEGGSVISGGPFQKLAGAKLSIYPSASSTSEVDEGDDNAYYASRGASVCSTLLHAMWQIDCRIRDPPSYSFDIVSSATVASPNETAECIIEVSAHRLPFQCTAKLSICFPKSFVDGKDLSSIMESWESPLEHLQLKQTVRSPQKRGDLSLEPSRKRKDSFAAQATTSPIRHQRPQDGESDELPSPTDLPEHEDVIAHQLECTATGSTKRESKHRASAKMLAMLFPECNSIVEVKAAAECARECYAAKKMSQTKRAKLSTNERTLESDDPNTSCSRTQADAHLEKEDSIGNDVEGEICNVKKSSAESEPMNEKERLGENFVSVAGLSLSEQILDFKQVEWSSDLVDREIIGDEIDTALRSLQDQEDDDRCAKEDRTFSSSDRLLLRRPNPDDFDYICNLAGIKTPTNSIKGRTSEDDTYLLDSTKIDNSSGLFIWHHQGSPIILMISSARTVESHDEPPSGFSVLCLRERKLVIKYIRHEDHLPPESVIECLDEFAISMNCNLENSNTSDLSSFDIVSLTERYFSDEKVSHDNGENHLNYVKSPRSQLQSVREEENEDADGSEEDDRHDAGGGKRTRVD